MRITELLGKGSIFIGCQASNKMTVIREGAELMRQGGHVDDTEAWIQTVLEREASGSTGIGDGIAIPHGKSSAVRTPGIAAMVLEQGVDFDSLDGEPVKLVFMIAVPLNESDLHLEIISRLSMLLIDPEFRQALQDAEDEEQFVHIIDEAERKKFGCEPEKKEENYQILAVTACPTGIAHTYMAQEALERAAAELGYTIKVETNGSCGIKNKLTPQEIEQARCIIIAADKQVDVKRFSGKKVIKARVSEGIIAPERLIREGMAEESISEAESGEKHRWAFYKHLMNGVSYMLPFVIGGGILIAIAFLLDDYTINPENFGMNTPVAAFFKTVGDKAFKFMLPVFSGFIAMSIADRPGLAAGFVGGVLAESGYTFSNIMAGSSGSFISSGFLGALAAGFLAGYVVQFLKYIFRWLPENLDGIKPMLIYPVAGILVTGGIMMWINPVIGNLNMGMNQFLESMNGSEKVVLGAVLGGMMALDMGGPFNKAAYLFGTASLANDGFDIMAAVMAGGMVPPLAIAICATFFKSKFSEKSRKMAFLNYIMGLSFITEGAIPFAAADPFRVIPACVAGAAVSGMLSMAFGCGLRAPHGGVFVIPTVIHPIQYILAIAAGALIGGICMGIFKRCTFSD